MNIEFDPAKDAENVHKHGISLARASGLVTIFYEADDRFNYDEVRYRAYGVLDGKSFCFVFTTRNGKVRAISLRRAHAKEMKKHAPQKK